jgi:hypothetical protein
MAVPTYNFPDHTKNDVFLARQITFNFDITGASILMQFKENKLSNVNGEMIFEWKTDDNSFEVIDPVLGVVIMKEKKITANAGVYVYDLQITYPTNRPITYFKGRINIIQDISTP